MLENFDIEVLNPRGTTPNLIQCQASDSTKLAEVNAAEKKDIRPR